MPNESDPMYGRYAWFWAGGVSGAADADGHYMMFGLPTVWDHNMDGRDPEYRLPAMRYQTYNGGTIGHWKAVPVPRGHE